MTNAGNGYKFKAIMENRSNKTTVLIQKIKKNGTWGKAFEARTIGNETPEQVVARYIKNNNCQYRLAQ